MRIWITIAATAAAAMLAIAAAPAEVASPWKIINGQKDPLTEKPARFAIAAPLSNPIFHDQKVTSALIIRCATIFQNKPSEPELMLLFLGLTGIGHIRNTLTAYRWDDGPVHSYTLRSSGVNGTRAIAIPKLVSPATSVKGEDPIADMAAAKRLRAKVQFASTAIMFLDFNVTGSSEAVRAVACQ